MTGRSFAGTGTMPQVVAVDDRDRAAPIALPRQAPVAQAEVDLALGDRLAAELLRLQALGDRVEGGLRVDPVEEARVDHHAVVVEGDALVLDGDTRLAGAGSSFGTTTGMIGSPYLRANSMSRWSPDGQPKMAPVP